MPAGSIVVELLAKTGSFDTDIDRSTKATEKRMREMQRTVDAAGTAIGIAMAAAGVAAVAFAKQTINGLDALNDVSDATGASIEKISALEDTALRTGNSFESVSSALIKFNQQLKDTDPDNKTAAILAKIGLNADQLRKMDPADALHQVARALAQFADDGDKARVVQELFGKSVREVAPLLKDLADQETLHATVTTQEAKAAEEFNKQLAEMHKNSMDLARSIASDLLPEVNAILRAFREGGSLGGIMALGGQMIGVGGDDPGQQLNVVSDKLRTLKTQLGELEAMPNGVRTINEAIFGDEADLARQIKALEGEKRFLQSLQQTAALAGVGDASDAMSRRLAPRAGIGPIPDTKKGPKGKDPDADFKAYLKNLQEQIQKVDQLTVSEKLLDDIRRGSLTVSPAQEKQLATLAALVDKDKERKLVMEGARAAFMASNDAYTAGLEEEKRRLDALLGDTDLSRLEKVRSDLQFLQDEFNREGSELSKSPELFRQAWDSAASRAQKPLQQLNFQLTETQGFLMDMGNEGMRAFGDLALHGGKFGDVMERLLGSLADMIFQLTVVKPLMNQLSGAIGIDRPGVPANPDAGFNWGSLFSTAASAMLGGAKAGGGPVSAGTPYLIGERGPEMFVPRTAGSVVPNSALGGGGGNVTIVNPPGTPRPDSVSEQRQPNGDRVITQHVVAQIGNPNSDISRAMQRSFNVRPKR